jgi:hypothetical protein
MIFLCSCSFDSSDREQSFNVAPLCISEGCLQQLFALKSPSAAEHVQWRDAWARLKEAENPLTPQNKPTSGFINKSRSSGGSERLSPSQSQAASPSGARRAPSSMPESAPTTEAAEPTDGSLDAATTDEEAFLLGIGGGTDTIVIRTDKVPSILRALRPVYCTLVLCRVYGVANGHAQDDRAAKESSELLEQQVELMLCGERRALGAAS